MPWKQGADQIKSNKEMSIKRLECTEKTLKRRQQADAYKSVISDYVKKGYIRKVSKDETNGRWYLPPFAISRPAKATTKTRIVFDASARYDGTSMNDFLHKGPKLQREVYEVLLRFRRYPVRLYATLLKCIFRSS